ncbi:MAG: hypothetical protein ACYDG2_05865 [Ruminiclostridium sp.]
MKKKQRVHKEPIESIKIPSSHGENINYIVNYGEVDWNKDDNNKRAVYILMEYAGLINYIRPAHILTHEGINGRSDFENVWDAVTLKQNISYSYLSMYLIS